MKGRSAGVALLVVAMTSGYRSVTTILDRAACIGECVLAGVASGLVCVPAVLSPVRSREDV